MAKILIIDDQVDDVAVKQKYADSLPGFKLCFATNGAAAIQFLRSEKKNNDSPKLIIVDQQFTYDCVDVDVMIEGKKWKVLPHDAVDEKEHGWPSAVLLSDDGPINSGMAVNQGLIIIKAIKHEIKADKISETPILFCSTQTDDDDTLFMAKTLGAKGHISKDSFAGLKATIDKMLEKENNSGMALAKILLTNAAKDRGVEFQPAAFKYLVKKCGALKSEEMEEVVDLVLGYIGMKGDEVQLCVPLFPTAEEAFKKATSSQGAPQIKKKINNELSRDVYAYFRGKTSDFYRCVFAFFEQILEKYLPEDNFEGCYLNCGKIIEQISSYAGNHKPGDKINKQLKEYLDETLSEKCCDIYADRSYVVHSKQPIKLERGRCVWLIQRTFAAVREFGKSKSYE